MTSYALYQQLKNIVNAPKDDALLIDVYNQYAAAKGLVVNAGHGLNLNNVAPIAAIPQIHELNIGHSIIADSIFVGLAQAVKDMKAAIQAAER